MPNIEFQGEQSAENRFASHSMQGSRRMPAMVKFLINTGVVKSESAANVLLVVIMTIFFLLSAVIFWRALGVNFYSSPSGGVSGNEL